MRTRSSATRAQQLLTDGQAAIDAGDYAGSIPVFERAAELGRAVLAAEPEQPRHRLALGAVCGGLGEALAHTGSYGAAVPVLSEALDAYRGAGPGTAAAVADLRLRRGRTYARLGAGASAVVDVQAAVLGHLGRGVDPDRVDSAYVDLARTLMQAADVFGAWADPPVALTAAREGLAWYVRAVKSGAHEMDLPLWLAMVRALSVESAVLRRTGRTESAATAEATLEWLGSEPVDTVTARRTLPPNVTTPTVAEAVAELERSTGTDGDLPELLLSEPLGPPWTPALRVPAALLPAAAGTCAVGARRLLGAAAPAAGLRLGLEAHYLYAVAFPDDAPGLADASAHWAILLAELAVRADAAGDADLAADLAEWTARVAARAPDRGP